MIRSPVHEYCLTRIDLDRDRISRFNRRSRRHPRPVAGPGSNNFDLIAVRGIEFVTAGVGDGQGV